jgi:BirA family biotin operon repressor/biotin-[acetyl-CoA-carboxylase] ligase
MSEAPQPISDAESDDLLAAGVARHLRERGLIWGAPVLAYASLDSTSDRLKALARGGAREWTTVVAREQTRGRGRQGRAWASPPGNLYLSVLLRPDAEVAAALVPLAVGVAVAETVLTWGVHARLKWPNDVLAAGERKLAGVLVEGATGGQGLEHLVVGVGINLDWEPDSLPELAAVATSVHAVTGRAPEVAPAAAALLAHLPAWYQALARDPRGLVAAWRERSVAWWGESVQVETGGRTLRGRLRDVSDDGALLLEGDDGSLHTLLSGEIARLRPTPQA